MINKSSLKDMFRQGKLIRAIGAHNGLTAKLVEEAGFDGVWSSGFEISTSHAVPDANILTMSDFLDVAQEMANTVSIPIIADCDTGFGNSNNVMHMVKKFESAGVSALCIEDKKFPKVNSFISGRQELAPLAEFVGKIMAAKNAQVSEDFMVFARVEALIANLGQDEALKRAQTYMDAGADGIFIHSKSNSPDEIRRFCKTWKKRAPLLISPTTYYLSEDEMGELGINIVIYANYGIRAAIKYIKQILGHIIEKGTLDLDSRVAPLHEVFRLQGMHIMKDHEKKYLKSELGTVKVIIPAAGAKIDKSLKSLLEDRPVGMLDINGKSLLQRNIEVFNAIGIQDVNVVVGYGAKKVNPEGAKIIKNQQFETNGIMHSIIKGIDSIADKNIIVYSDIILDQHLLQKLLKKDDDFTIVVDSTYKKTHCRNKKLELVEAKFAPVHNFRMIDINRKNLVCRIGKNLSEAKAHFEFTGIALLSRRGMEILIKEYKKARISKLISFADFIQHLIARGYEIIAYEVNSGWMEVHNFNDYKKACSIFT